MLCIAMALDRVSRRPMLDVVDQDRVLVYQLIIASVPVHIRVHGVRLLSVLVIHRVEVYVLDVDRVRVQIRARAMMDIQVKSVSITYAMEPLRMIVLAHRKGLVSEWIIVIVMTDTLGVDASIIHVMVLVRLQTACVQEMEIVSMWIHVVVGQGMEANFANFLSVTIFDRMMILFATVVAHVLILTTVCVIIRISILAMTVSTMCVTENLKCHLPCAPNGRQEDLVLHLIHVTVRHCILVMSAKKPHVMEFPVRPRTLCVLEKEIVLPMTNVHVEKMVFGATKATHVT